MRRPAPRFFKLSYLVTAWTQRPEDEHRLLDNLLRTFLKYDALPDDLVVGQLAEPREAVKVTIGLPPPEDRAFADVWSALGGELKPSLDLVVFAPMWTGREYAAGAAVEDGLTIDTSDLVDGGSDDRAGRSTSRHRRRMPRQRRRPRHPGPAGGSRNDDPAASPTCSAGWAVIEERIRLPGRDPADDGPGAGRPVPRALSQRRGRRPAARRLAADARRLVRRRPPGSRRARGRRRRGGRRAPRCGCVTSPRRSRSTRSTSTCCWSASPPTSTPASSRSSATSTTTSAGAGRRSRSRSSWPAYR